MDKQPLDEIKDKIEKMPDSSVKTKILEDIEKKKKHKIIIKDGIRN